MSAAQFLARTLRGETPRRWICALLASGYAFAAAGIPLPVATSTKSDQLFPCAAKGCGCDSAERCWRSCCCHTLAERLAWAAKNGVTPPAFALAEAKRAGLDAKGQPIVQAKVVTAAVLAKSCCSKKRTCCDSHTKSCCESHQAPKSETKSDFIVAWRALACHGQSLQWLAAVPTLIAVELEFSNDLAPTAWLRPPASLVASPLSDAPTSPPPERA
jgi:hypothetical protein